MDCYVNTIVYELITKLINCVYLRDSASGNTEVTNIYVTVTHATNNIDMNVEIEKDQNKE